LREKKTDFDTLTSFCPKFLGLSQQNVKETEQFFWIEGRKGRIFASEIIFHTKHISFGWF